MSDAGLPPGWVETSLGQLIESQKNGIYKAAESYTADGVPCLRMYNINNGRLDMRDLKRMFLTSEELELFGLRAGDILVNRVNTLELVGKSCVIPPGLGPLTFESKNIRVRLTEAVDPRYIGYAMQDARVRVHFRMLGKQTAGMATVDQDAIRAVPISLPPVNEQRRIVSRLDALLARARDARGAFADIPTLIAQVQRSVLTAAFRGDLTAAWREAHPDVEPASALLERIRAERRRRWEEANPRKAYVEPAPINREARELPELPVGWEWASVDQLVWDGPRNGYSGRTAADATGTLTLKLSATTQGQFIIDETTTKRLTEVIEPGSDLWLQPGDLLVQRANTIDLVGSAAVFPGHTEPLVYPDLMMRLRPVAGLLGEWMWRWFNSPACRAWFRSQATGTAGNMPKINGAILRTTAVPIGPAEEMREALDAISRALEVAETARRQATDALRDVDTFERALLAKAFRGELVEQDPTDEPAEALLARVRAAAKPAKGRGAKRATRGGGPAPGGSATSPESPRRR